MREVIGVLRGGPSSEYEVSLKSGASVLEALDHEKYDPRDIFISRKGQWHVHGVPVTPEAALRGVGVVFNVIHGEYGEDGQLHRILDAFGVPYTGAGAAASTLAFNKQRTRDAVKELGVKVAHGIVVDHPPSGGPAVEEIAHQIFRSFPHPAVIKPVIGGSSVGVTMADSFDKLVQGLERAWQIAPQALVEEYIAGKEATVGIIDNFRDEKTYALMPVEIIPPSENPFFDYDAKYSGETIERVPGSFTQKESQELMRIAKLVHEKLGMSHYSRSDFIVGKRGIYFLEINSAAAVGLTKESLLPKAVYAVGAKLSDFLEHIINLARGQKTR
ncbi:MAG: ATP-grasp domain-containing protein [bacterium]|nr:ATP-grasp domain-containing protein [bacterium]